MIIPNPQNKHILYKFKYNIYFLIIFKIDFDIALGDKRSLKLFQRIKSYNTDNISWYN